MSDSLGQRLHELNKNLGFARERILGRENELAEASAKVLVHAGNTAAHKFETHATSHVIAAANGEGAAKWNPPHADEVIDVGTITAELRSKSDPIRRAAIAEYGAALAAISKKVGVPISWDVTNPLVGAVYAGAAQHVHDIADTTRLGIMRTIKAAYEEGLTISDTATAIRGAMKEATPARARLIARCELAAVANGGSLAVARIYSEATGETLWKRWAVAPGADFPRHELVADLDGQSRLLTEPFDVDGALLEFPADPGGPPDETANCRCVMLMLDSRDAESPTPS
jgi:hypothetical protein